MDKKETKAKPIVIDKLFRHLFMLWFDFLPSYRWNSNHRLKFQPLIRIQPPSGRISNPRMDFLPTALVGPDVAVPRIF